MTAQIHIARRRRRCALGSACPNGGRIAPGERAIRAKQHAYVHVADLDRLLELLAAAMPIVTRFFESMTDVMNEIIPIIAEFGEAILAAEAEKESQE